MINPGVISLASLQAIENSKFPYRFDVEDNIGEAIHIHYKDIRIDLTTNEFEALSRKMVEIINDIVEVDSFDCNDFDPVFLVGISDTLPELTAIEHRKVYLEDILVDTYDTEGNPIYASIASSRVVKALNGLIKENDSHTIQFNHFRHGTNEKLTNSERIAYNLERIKKYGYPYSKDIISIDSENKIIDGQHRASCLFYLYGNIEIDVRTLVYDNRNSCEVICTDSLSEIEHELFLSENSKKPVRWFSKILNWIFGVLWLTGRAAVSYRNENNDRLSHIEQELQDIKDLMSR